MENQGNPSVMELTVKAGETIILKGEDGATISEVKKPKRNTAKEREWEQSKYHRFTFLVDKPQAERFIELLDGVRPLDWFREQITNFTNNTLNVNESTLNVDNNNTLNEINDLKNRLEVALKMNAIENNQELATLKAEMSKAFKLDHEDFQNSKDKEHSQELCDIYRVIISRFFKGLEKFGIIFTTLNDVEKTFNVDNKNEKPKQVRKPPPNADERGQWETEYNNGLSAKRIAEIFGRDIRAVKKHLERVGLAP